MAVNAGKGGDVVIDREVYFSKVEFRYTIGRRSLRSIILLNIPEQELLYQVYKFEKTTQNPFADLRVIRNQKTDFNKQLIQDAPLEDEVVFSYGVKLSDEEMRSVLPLCNALEFEPYRGRKHDDNEGYISSLDEAALTFQAVTDSHIPLIEMHMDRMYDVEHLWPNERLYRYLIVTYLSDGTKIPGWKSEYNTFHYSKAWDKKYRRH